MEQRTLTLPALSLAAEQLGFFRWGRVGDRVVVTTDAGDWALLDDAELADLLAGRIGEGHARFAELQTKGILRDGLDLDALATRLAQRHRHLRRTASVHVVTLTRRRPGSNGDAGGAAAGDLSRETAEAIVDWVLQSPASALHIDLQGDGGEPLLNFETLCHFVDVARARNRRATGKALTFTVFTTCAAMTEERAEWLLANDVQVVTRFDGPARVHDWNRQYLPGPAHAAVAGWLDYFTRRAAELGGDATRRIGARLTVTRRTLDEWRAVVDEYVARGLRTLHFTPLERGAVSAEVWDAIGYPPAAYLDSYRAVLAYCAELAQRDVAIRERRAAIVAAKILAEDPGTIDVQSPDGAGTVQLAYGIDGSVYPADEARRLDEASGEPLFALGTADRLGIADVVRHPTVRAIAAASLLDAQPQCADCWNKPFCGFSPLRTYRAQGDLFGQRPHCLECRTHLALSTWVVERLAGDADGSQAALLRGWTTAAPAAGDEGRAITDAP